jgi:RHS repeat-associated protein
LGRERWYRLDALGHLAEVVEPDPKGRGSVFDPGNVVTRYSFNALGRLTRTSQGDQVREFQYDAVGNLTAEYLPEKSRSLDNLGHHVTSGGMWSDVFTYDEQSNLTSHIDARGVKTNYSYDPLRSLLTIRYDLSGAWDGNNPVAPTRDVIFQHMNTGDIRRLKAIYSPPGPDPASCRQDFDYNPTGRLASQTSTCQGAEPLAIDYSYDSLGRITDRLYPVQFGAQNPGRRLVSSHFGIGGSVTAVTLDNAPVASQITYNASGFVASLVMGEGGPQTTTDTFSYDPLTERFSGQAVMRGGSKLLDLGFGYDLTGQLTSLFDNVRTQHLYRYDALGRLSTVTDPSLWSIAYDYDRFGNRTSVKVTGKAADGSPIPSDGLPEVNYDPATNHIANTGYSYDASGNLTRSTGADGSWFNYRYDAAGRLATVTTDTGVLLRSHSYGPDGRRLVTQRPAPAGSTYYAWDGNHVIGEYGPRMPVGTFSWFSSDVYLGNRLLARVAPGASSNPTQYFHWDRLGIRLITDSSAPVLFTQVTLPFGTRLPHESNSQFNPIFTSYDRDLTTGMDYAVNRFYDSQTRFLQPDPAGMAAVSLAKPQSLNQYAYVANNPIMHVDPIGLDETCSDNGDGTSNCVHANGEEWSETRDNTTGERIGNPQVTGEVITVVAPSGGTESTAAAPSGIGASGPGSPPTPRENRGAPNPDLPPNVCASSALPPVVDFFAPRSFGIGVVVDAQYLAGVEFNLQFVFDTTGNFGLMFTPALRAGFDANLSAGISGFLSTAPSITNLRGGSIGVAVDLGSFSAASFGGSVAIDTGSDTLGHPQLNASYGVGAGVGFTGEIGYSMLCSYR